MMHHRPAQSRRRVCLLHLLTPNHDLSRRFDAARTVGGCYRGTKTDFCSSIAGLRPPLSFKAWQRLGPCAFYSALRISGPQRGCDRTVVELSRSDFVGHDLLLRISTTCWSHGGGHAKRLQFQAGTATGRARSVL